MAKNKKPSIPMSAIEEFRKAIIKIQKEEKKHPSCKAVFFTADGFEKKMDLPYPPPEYYRFPISTTEQVTYAAGFAVGCKSSDFLFREYRLHNVTGTKRKGKMTFKALYKEILR